MPKRCDLALNRTRIYIVDLGQVVLSAARTRPTSTQPRSSSIFGVTLLLGTGVKQTGGPVLLSDGQEILTRTVVWAGGIQAPELATKAGLPQGRGGRLEAQPDLSVDGSPAPTPSVTWPTSPTPTARISLSSVRRAQAGRWAAKNILADCNGKPSSSLPLQGQGHHGDDR